MKPFTFLQAKQVIKSPIPFRPYSKLTKKPTKAFFLNLSSDFDLTSNSKRKHQFVIDNGITKRNNTQTHSLEFKNCLCSGLKSKISYAQNSSRLETKESTNNKQFQQIEEEDLSDSALTEKSISFSAFIIPSHEYEPVNTFSALCKSINLVENSKKTKKPIVKRRMKARKEIELEKITQEREKCQQLRITNNIMIEKIKNKETGHLSQTSKHRIIPKPFELVVNRGFGKERKEIHCCAFNKKKNVPVCNQITKAIKYNSHQAHKNKLEPGFKTKGCLTQR